ncbi:MAG: hypothetical protein A2X94_11295 [Bdellovibrionales bacterium GWB1_55_8]|nr:MAG: hypothetical protein A2X94_11295 [Bdellovibrionales bacterium GWB1_55_8]
MLFHRDLSRDQVANAWISDLSESCSGKCDKVLSQVRDLLRSLPDIKTGQKIVYLFFSTGVELLIDGRKLGELKGADAAHAVLSAFIGATTPAIYIRAALLGTTRSS